ncbi:MAG: hypothetical protein U1F52_03590 [Burkholderiales bacterium]
MMTMTKTVAAIAVAAVGGLAVPQALAGEKGHFRGLAVLVSTNFQMIKATEGHPGGAVMMGEMDGLVFNDAKGALLDKAHYQVFWKGEGSGTGDCLKTFTVAGGDKLFASCAGKASATGWEGTVKLHGGTGRFAGAKGSGTYKLTNVSDKVMWDVLEWDYELP